MNWGAIGAIAELVGAAGVILSLVYLALQIRQNTVQVETSSGLMRAESFRTWKTHATQVNLAIAHDEKLAGVFRRGLMSFKELGPDEQIQFTFLFSEMLSSMDTLLDEQSHGIADPRSRDRVASSTGPLLQTPGGREFWRIHGRRFGSGVFRDWVESEVLGEIGPDVSGPEVAAAQQRAAADSA